MPEFALSHHAIQRALDMALDPAVIRELILRPEIKRWDTNPNHPPAWLYKRGDLAAFVDDSNGRLHIRTFIHATEAAWREQAHLPAAPGRHLRYLTT